MSAPIPPTVTISPFVSATIGLFQIRPVRTVTFSAVWHVAVSAADSAVVSTARPDRKPSPDCLDRSWEDKEERRKKKGRWGCYDPGARPRLESGVGVGGPSAQPQPWPISRALPWPTSDNFIMTQSQLLNSKGGIIAIMFCFLEILFRINWSSLITSEQSCWIWIRNIQILLPNVGL